MANYEEVAPISKELALKAFASGDPDRISNALLAIALHDGDWQWVQDICLQFLDDNDLDISALAATCLGHVARIHGQIDKTRVINALQSKMPNSKIKGTLEDACDDIETFAK